MTTTSEQDDFALGQNALISELRNELERSILSRKALEQRVVELMTQQNHDFARSNVAVGAIYRMVELIKNTSVTHAQREGNFLLLLNFIDKAWPSHNGRSYQSTAGDDIPF